MQNFAQKMKFKIKKKGGDFGGFQLQELRKKKRQIFLLGFQCVAKIYNDDNQRIFYFTFGWMIATLATNKIIPKK
jgi:hypothetical protein